jgi:hypothetical protein
MEIAILIVSGIAAAAAVIGVFLEMQNRKGQRNSFNFQRLKIIDDLREIIKSLDLYYKDQQDIAARNMKNYYHGMDTISKSQLLKPNEFEKLIKYCKDFEEGFTSYIGGGNNRIFQIPKARVPEKTGKSNMLIKFLEEL